MATTSVTASSNYSLTTVTRVPKKELDKNDFLALLATQLQNQDPLDPQSNDEFIATMAQFNSLEAMSSIDSTTQYSKAMSMVGKTVTIQEDNADSVTGTVEKVSTDEDGAVYWFRVSL
ncbi:MAG: flagellar hook capping protein, partial [Firmicutes bacterium]|nr:flagellar hook capping protein [Bacillota bacterium]